LGEDARVLIMEISCKKAENTELESDYEHGGGG
jgi:hypothetical protein